MSATRTTTVPSARRRYVTINEAATYLGCSVRTVRQRIADGHLTGYRMNKRMVRLDLDQVDAAMVPFGGGVA